jgi:hypothetical protein
MRTSTPLDDLLWESYRAQPARSIPLTLTHHGIMLSWPRGSTSKRIETTCGKVRGLQPGARSFMLFHYKSISFFNERAPATLSMEEQALWAGVAEGLCNKLYLTVPEWTNEPRYFLAEPWDSSVLYSILSSSIAQRLSESDPEFSRRNVVARIRDFLVA